MTKYGPGSDILSADALIGDKVFDNTGEILGTLENIMLDVDTGQMAYAVIAFAVWPEASDQYFAIPWHLLKLEPVRKQLILDVDLAVLQTAPRFARDTWPSMDDIDWSNAVHRHFGIRPYWEQ